MGLCGSKEVDDYLGGGGMRVGCRLEKLSLKGCRCEFVGWVVGIARVHQSSVLLCLLES